MNNTLRLHIKDFRAIHDADIVLNGITVVSGENGCGKSTISKVLYRILKTAIDYDKIKNKELQYRLYSTKRNLYNIGEDIYRYAARIDKNTEGFPNDIGSVYRGVNDTIKEIQIVSNLINSYGYTIVNAGERYIRIVERLNTSLRNILRTKEKDDSNFEVLLQRINDKMLEDTEKIKKQINKRSIDTLDEELSQYFENKQIKPFELYEYGALITDREIKRLNNINSIDKTIYIDTPMSIGFNEFIENNNFAHWNDIDELLRKKSNDNSISNLDNYFRDNINGDISIDNMSHLFKYRRKSDGLEINLLDAATGIKSFAAIQLLLKNGHLTDKTLMIIDEPEAHLHPQWIIEYAHLLVLLNKEIGVKFLIASHSPDMVRAIQYISEKENGEDTKDILNFYVAQKQEKEKYNYKFLGTDIEDIFESFNMSIDRINSYSGITYEED